MGENHADAAWARMVDVGPGIEHVSMPSHHDAARRDGSSELVEAAQGRVDARGPTGRITKHQLAIGHAEESTALRT